MYTFFWQNVPSPGSLFSKNKGPKNPPNQTPPETNHLHLIGTFSWISISFGTWIHGLAAGSFFPTQSGVGRRKHPPKKRTKNQPFGLGPRSFFSAKTTLTFLWGGGMISTKPSASCEEKTPVQLVVWFHFGSPGANLQCNTRDPAKSWRNLEGTSDFCWTHNIRSSCFNSWKLIDIGSWMISSKMTGISYSQWQWQESLVVEILSLL